MMLLPCMTSSSFTLRFFIGWSRHKYRKYSRTTVWIWLLCFKYVLYFILLVFWFRRSDSNSIILYILQIHLRKRDFRTLNPSYLGNVSFATFTMAVNLPQTTLLCVITLCVWLFSLYDQDLPFLDFVVLSVVVFVVPSREFVGREVGRIWRLATEPGRGQRRRRYREPSSTPPTHRGENLDKFLSHPSTTHNSNQGGVEPWKTSAHLGSLGEGGC